MITIKQTKELTGLDSISARKLAGIINKCSNMPIMTHYLNQKMNDVIK